MPDPYMADSAWAFELEGWNRMRQTKLVSLGVVLVIAVAGFCGTMTGCGDTGGTSDVTVTPGGQEG